MPESYKPVTGLFNPPAWMTNAPKPDLMGGMQAAQQSQINKVKVDQARRAQEYAEQLSQTMQGGQGQEMPDFEGMLQMGMQTALQTGNADKAIELARAQFNLQRQQEYDEYRNRPQIRNAPDGSLVQIDPNTGEIIETIMQKPPKAPSAEGMIIPRKLQKGSQTAIATTKSQLAELMRDGWEEVQKEDDTNDGMNRILNAAADKMEGRLNPVPTPSNTPMPESTPSGPNKQAGMITIRDKETGELLQVTPEQLAELQRQ